jgi:hypothetical protein
VLQVLQSKQIWTYLADQTCCIPWKKFKIQVTTQSKLPDVSSLGAAPDASPLATILLAMAILLPRVEKACRITGDALLEGQ